MILVNVRWWDGYLETFECSEVRQGGHILWMKLMNGQNRTVPLVEIHARVDNEDMDLSML